MDNNKKPVSLARKNWPFYILVAAISFLEPFLLNRIEWGTLIAWYWGVPILAILVGVVFTLIRKRFDWWFPLVIFLGNVAGGIEWDYVGTNFVSATANFHAWCVPAAYCITVGCGIQAILDWRARKRAAQAEDT